MTTTTIKELFEKPIDRPIDGVIKADDERHLQTELDEYVVTREVAKGLDVFTERTYTTPRPMASGSQASMDPASLTY